LHGILDAFDIIYLQYWLQDVKESFPKHHVVLKHQFASAHMPFPKKKCCANFGVGDYF
jgi:hypothetical protein